jgi:cytochrome oxidase assembly protein ShyY1
MDSVSLQNIRKQLNLPMVLFTLLVFSILIKLGLWQSERAVEKTQRLERIEQLSVKKALSLSQVLALQDMRDGINDLPISLSGEFDSEHIFLLDNQPNKGRLGYRVLQVVHSNGHAVLVNLGWVQGSIDRNQLPDVKPITGLHTLLGHVRKVEIGIQLMEQNFSNSSWPVRVQQIELDKFSQLIDDKLLPFVVYLDKKEAIGYKKNWQPIVMPPEKHQAYAFQWFSLAIAWLSLMIWAAIKVNRIKSDTVTQL